jgi:hypothetical protein
MSNFILNIISLNFTSVLGLPKATVGAKDQTIVLSYIVYFMKNVQGIHSHLDASFYLFLIIKVYSKKKQKEKKSCYHAKSGRQNSSVNMFLKKNLKVKMLRKIFFYHSDRRNDIIRSELAPINLITLQNLLLDIEV